LTTLNPNRRSLALICLGAAFSAALTASAAQNILLIIADDLGADSSSLCNSTNAGASLPPTPNIQALARDGVVFRNAYANPVCSPSRACLLTGRYAFRHGVGNVVTGPGSAMLSATEFTLPKAFAADAAPSYQLAQFGKWHLHTAANSPLTVGGWPHFAGSLTAALANYTNWTKTINGVTELNHATYATTDLVNDARAWIQARGQQPWFAWVAFNAAHAPLHKPPNSLHGYDSLSGTQQDISARPRPYFEAMAEAMDTEIGRLLAVVDRANTHIIFLGDNGTPGDVIQPPYRVGRAKGTLYEGGIRVPLLIAGPAVVNPGRTNSALVHAVDLFATILELAGMNITSSIPTNVVLDSRSLMPALRDQSEAARYVYDELFGDGFGGPSAQGRALRDEQFKLLRFANGREELYDLETDPYEATNLLSRALTAVQRAHYYSLVMRLGDYQDTLAKPVIVNYSSHSNQFSVTVAGAANLTYSLWRASTLQELAWAPVNGALVVTNETATVTLTDPTADSGLGFYRVEAHGP
jgi:arylsulfatase B